MMKHSVNDEIFCNFVMYILGVRKLPGLCTSDRNGKPRDHRQTKQLWSSIQQE